MATARIPLRDWDGPSGRSLIQGVKSLPDSSFVVAQADNVGGQAEQDTVLRAHDRTMAYTGLTCTVKQGGHGSSFGVFESGRTNILLGHAKLGPVRFLLTDGTAGGFLRIEGVPNGDWTCDESNDLASVRIGERYEGYTLSSLLAGRPKQLFRTVVPNFLNRFQGHYLTRINGALTLCIHRDVETQGRSEARLHTITSSSKWRTLDTINTTHMGDEAEGFCIRVGRLYVVKRTGGGGADRTVDLTPTSHLIGAAKPATPSATRIWHVKSKMYARRPDVDKEHWELRPAGFPIDTGVAWERRTFPDRPKPELYLRTKSGRYYRRVKLA